MKTITLALTASLLPACFAVPSSHQTAAQQVPAFECIEVDGPLNVSLVAGQTHRIEQKTQGPQNFVASIVEDCLQVRAIDANTKTELRIQSPSLQTVRATDGAVVAVNDLQSERLSVEAEGGSEIALSGVVHTLDACATGGSRIDGVALRATTAVVSVNGSSEAGLIVRERIEVDATEDSSVRYRGAPRLVSHADEAPVQPATVTACQTLTNAPQA